MGEAAPMRFIGAVGVYNIRADLIKVRPVYPLLFSGPLTPPPSS